MITVVITYKILRVFVDVDHDKIFDVGIHCILYSNRYRGLTRLEKSYVEYTNELCLQ